MLYLPRIQPDEPAEYHQLAAGPDRRWYRPILALLIGFPVFLVLNLAVTLVPMLFVDDSMKYYATLMQLDTTNPATLAILMLSLIVLIPAVLVGAILGMRMHIGYVFSVDGRLRWKWQFIALGVAILMFAIVFVPIFLLEDVEWQTPSNVVLLIALSIVLVPFQSAAEEITFRGAILQGIGSWIPNRWAALIVATLLSASLFALAHGSLDPWILIDLGLFAATAVFLTWFTGGLEAAIALHAGNNVVIFVTESIRGTSESLVNESSSSSPGSVGLSALIMIAVAAVLAFLSRKLKLNRVHDPAKRPYPTVAYLADRLSSGEYLPKYEELYPEAIRACYSHPAGYFAGPNPYAYAPQGYPQPGFPGQPGYPGQPEYPGPQAPGQPYEPFGGQPVPEQPYQPTPDQPYRQNSGEPYQPFSGRPYQPTSGQPYQQNSGEPYQPFTGQPYPGQPPQPSAPQAPLQPTPQNQPGMPPEQHPSYGPRHAAPSNQDEKDETEQEK